jgi:glutamine synthetase
VFSNSEEILKFIADEKVEYLDVRFCDLPGVMQHLTVPAATAADILEDGVAFDGSSVRGFQAINESDMALFPDAATARLDPFRKHKTLNINFFVHDPITGEPYSRDPRNVARKAEEYLAASGVADTCYFGAEAEFYIFDSIRFGSDPHQPTTTSTPPRAGGTPAATSRAATWATRSTTRAGTSPCPRWTTTPTCAPTSSAT